MATYTDNYQLTKPLYSETADIAAINNNMDKVDDIMHNSQISLADAYDQTQTYELGEKVMYEMLLYRCVSRITTPEVWNPSHWERTTAADEGGNYVDVDEKFQTGLNVADVDIDGDQHYIKVPYMTGATSQADGAGGLVPAPEAGDEDKFLKGDGSWDDVPAGGSTVTITPETIAEPKAKVADYSIDGVSDSIYAPIIQIDGKASGAIANFNDGSANPLEELVIGITPVQSGSGDPSPSNRCPISGWTGANVNVEGKNLLPIDININDSTYAHQYTKTTYPELNIFFKSIQKLIGKSVMVSGTISGTVSGVPVGQISINNVGTTLLRLYPNQVNTIPDLDYSNADRIIIYGSGNGAVIKDLQIEVGTQATEYKPFISTTYPITWSEAGTVYEGYIEFKDGERKAYRTGGRTKVKDLNWTYHSTSSIFQTLNIKNTNVKAEIYKTVQYASWSLLNNYDIACGNTDCVIKDETYTDVTSFIQARGEDYIYYELATPIEITLDSPLPTINTLPATNNIWADTGDIINCKYIRDLNSTINILWNAVFNQSNTRSLSLMKSVKSEDTDTKEVEKEIEEEETEKEIQKEGNDENQR